MRAYAEGTQVSAEKSKSELDTLLAKHGATQRGVMSDDAEGTAVVFFRLHDRHYRLDVPLPKLGDYATPAELSWKQAKGKKVPQRWDHWTVAQRTQWVRWQHEQGCRERWRAVVLLVKAKLEIVQLGLSSAEREFLADLVLPDGRRMHQALADKIAAAYLEGVTPVLLLGPAGST